MSGDQYCNETQMGAQLEVNDKLHSTPPPQNARSVAGNHRRGKIATAVPKIGAVRDDIGAIVASRGEPNRDP